MGGPGGGQVEPEEEREFFFREVDADADGLEDAGRHLLAHLLDSLDDMGGGEGATHHARGEEAGVDRGNRESGRLRSSRKDGVDGAEALEDPGASPFGFGVPEVFHALTILVPTRGDHPNGLDGPTPTNISKCL